MFSEIERTVQVIESELIGDWQNVYLLAPSPDGMISNPSTKIARQCHSAEWRERIFFPLSFAFFALALLATVLFCEQMCWLAFLFALRAVCAARSLRLRYLAEGDEAFFDWGRARPGRGAGRAQTALDMPVSRPLRRGSPPVPRPAGPAVPRRGTNRKNGRFR